MEDTTKMLPEYEPACDLWDRIELVLSTQSETTEEQEIDGCQEGNMQKGIPE